jgi:hypothetical protein
MKRKVHSRAKPPVASDVEISAVRGRVRGGYDMDGASFVHPLRASMDRGREVRRDGNIITTP